MSQADLAIQAALEGNWESAIELNNQILTINPSDIASLNRLAKAYVETHQTDKAIESYKQVLLIDKTNPIALKQCERLSNGKCIPTGNPLKTITDFLDIPGRTKSVTLARLGHKTLLTSLSPGDTVNLIPKNHWIAVETPEHEHIGTIPDNISFRLKQLIKTGNEYAACVYAASATKVVIFIRETVRSEANKTTPSFV